MSYYILLCKLITVTVFTLINIVGLVLTKLLELKLESEGPFFPNILDRTYRKLSEKGVTVCPGNKGNRKTHSNTLNSEQ